MVAVGTQMADCLVPAGAAAVAVAKAVQQPELEDFRWHCSEMWLDLGSVDCCMQRCRSRPEEH